MPMQAETLHSPVAFLASTYSPVLDAAEAKVTGGVRVVDQDITGLELVLPLKEVKN